MESKLKFKLNDWILLTAVFFLLASFVGTLAGVTRITSLAFTLSLVTVVAFFVYRCIFRRGINWYFLVIVLLVGLSLIIGGLSSSFEYYKPAIILLASLACIEFSSEVCVSDTTKKIAAGLIIAASVLLIVSFHFFGLKDKLYGTTELVSMNFQNPNEAAMWIMCFIGVAVMSIGLFSNMYLKIACGAVAVLLVPLILSTKSRNALVACIFFAFAYAVVSFFKIRKLPRWVHAVVTFSPLIVFAVYMIILSIVPDALDTVIGDDPSKIMSSRAGIWTDVLESFTSCFIAGDYGEFNDRQMHNSFATIFCQYGLPLLIAAACFMSEISYRLQNKISIYASLSLCTLFVSGCFETSLFGGVAGLYLMFFIFPACCKERKRKVAADVEQ